MPQFTITSHQQKEIVDITNRIQDLLKQTHSETGLVHCFLSHTTAALTTADLDPGTDQDYLSFIKEVTPQVNWNHPHNPAHVPDHIWSTIIGPDVTIPVQNGTLQLGTWQRIVLIELDGPRERKIIVSFIPTNR